jgi:hypothetical protein
MIKLTNLLNEIQIKPINKSIFTIVDDGAGIEYKSKPNDIKSIWAPYDKDANSLFFQLGIDAGYEDIDFLGDNPEAFLANVHNLDPEFDTILFSSFINDLNRLKIPFEFYYDEDGGDIYATIQVQNTDIKPFINNILKEIKVEKFKAPKDLLDKMLSFETERDTESILGKFVYHNNFEDWYDDNDRYDENSEIVNLAKVFFKWENNKDIIVFRVEDSDSQDEILLNKQYKRLTYYGLGEQDARIILTTF